MAADQEDNHKEDVHIPPELFAKNVALKRLWITIDHTPERRVYLSEDAFAENTNLAEVQLQVGDFRTHKSTFAHLTELTSLHIGLRSHCYKKLLLPWLSASNSAASTSDSIWRKSFRTFGEA